MQKIKKPVVIFIFLCGGLLGFSNASAKTHLRVGYLPILDHLILLVSHAQDNQTFKSIEIEPKLFKSWRGLEGALRAGVIDAAFILSPLAMDLFNKGVDIKTILLAHRDGSAITVKSNSFIQSALDLKGKAIAIPDRRATHTALLNVYLTKNANLSLKDVVTKVIAPPDMLKAMQLNRIDAFIVAEPFGSMSQDQGVGKLLILTKDIVNNHVDCIVVIRQDKLRENPVAIQEWITSLIQAGQWIDEDKLQNHSEQVAQLTKKYLPYAERAIMSGLQNPNTRISFSDLNPDKADFQIIVDISRQAELIDAVDLDAFIEGQFYQDTLEK
jgi:NitT/TauT family transport system substrate-binding protein